jgi:hypothetical protein
MIETLPDQIQRYSAASEAIRRSDISHIWTCIEADNVGCIVPGFHRVNAEYYVVTAHPWERDTLVVNL